MLEEVAAKERAAIARLLIQKRYNLAAVERTHREIDRARARLRSQGQPATAGGGGGSSRTASSRRSSGKNQTATERGGGNAVLGLQQNQGELLEQLAAVNARDSESPLVL